jgi:hypothetical protein
LQKECDKQQNFKTSSFVHCKNRKFFYLLYFFVKNTLPKMKYRRLSETELNQLEKQFVNFLVANTITGSDWANIKKERPAYADKLVDIFSDMAFEASLKNLEYLKFREPKDMKIFHCGKETITLMGLCADEKTNIDFTQEIDIKQVMLNTEGLSIYRNEKKYSPSREQELFKMMESGCRISDNYLFNLLEKLYQN